MLSFFSAAPCIDFLTLINMLAFPASVSEALLQMVKREFLQGHWSKNREKMTENIQEL